MTSSAKQRLVVVGNGMAPGRALERLFEQAPDAYEVTIFNAEPRVNYDRIMLSPVLSGEKSFEEIVIHGDGWYVKHGVTLYKGARVTKIDRAARTVTAEYVAAGSLGHKPVEPTVTVPFDRLIVGTGSNPIVIPVPGHDLPGVLSYRDLDDVQAMLLAAKGRGRAVVIGGGLLGLEAAAGLKEQGMNVTVLHLMPTLMERQLDPAAGHLLQRAIEARGIRVITRANTKAILGAGRVEAVELDNGTRLPAELVIMAVGIRPNMQLAKEAGLAVNRGIVVDATMRTSDPDIFALGECAEADGQVFGLVAPLYEMANVVAAQLTGDAEARFKSSATATKLKVTGINLYSAGDFAEAKDREEIVLRDAARGQYRRLVLKDNKVIGTVLYGDTADGPWFFDLLKRGADVADLRERLIFGQSYAAGGIPLDPSAAVAALPDDAEICGCNGVCKGKITGAIAGLGLKSLDEVRAHTKASASCGSCTGLVEQLLKAQLGEAYNPAAVQPMCGCTDLGHDDVRRLIVARSLKSIPELMQVLEWKTSCGCAKCRPALNYYMLCSWPGEYVDDSQSRFINERVHANIQKDGTYSVVPRMWGGQTSARELRAIADIVERYDIPTVKVTGGQRIDLLGVRKDQLPGVWRDLNAAGMVSGHAYGKALRTVKTCVGSEWCRFGVQDSTNTGIELERRYENLFTPHKYKMGVVGCPRNCAEATVKDLGLVGQEGSWQVVVGGAAGKSVRKADLLITVETTEEALQASDLFFQYYRENANYLERTYDFVERLGIEKVRKDTVYAPEADKKGLLDRLSRSKALAKDAWLEREQPATANQFVQIQPLVSLEPAGVQS